MFMNPAGVNGAWLELGKIGKKINESSTALLEPGVGAEACAGRDLET